MNQSRDHIVFRTAKSWVQSQEPVLVWQVTPWVGGRKTEGKAFLRLDARQNSFGATLTDEKPAEGLTSEAAFTQQLRKHVPTGTVTEAWRDGESGDLWFAVYTAAGEAGGAHWYVALTRARPPELLLMTKDGLIHVSYGARGTFTKRRTHEGPLPHLDPSRFVPIAASLWHALAGETESPAADGHAEPPADAEDPEKASPTTAADGAAAEGVALSADARALAQRLRRRLKTLRKARAKQAALVPDEAAIAARERDARLLQKYLYLVKEGDFALTLGPEETGLDAAVTVSLDPERSPGRNLEDAFHEVKRLRKAVAMGARELAKIDRDAAEAEAALARVLGGEATATVEAATPLPRPNAGVGSGASRGEPPVAKPYRAFLSSEGYRMLVGKGAGENDELTKAAKGNDWWVHAVGVTGSHVVIPAVKDIRDALPTRTLREAAILALHYSKLKGDMAGEVYVTRKGDLRKQKGMPKGLWTILRSDTFFFRYAPDEADAILGRPAPA